ncbi:MAG TPA: pitrilysin family protein [Rhodothermales bacterium]
MSGSHSEDDLLSTRVSEERVGDWQVLAAPMDVDSVVSIRGSFCTYPDFDAGEAVLQDLAVALLDKGTRKRDRFKLAEVLDESGAQVTIVSDALRVRFSVRTLVSALPRVIDVLGEELREPLFDPAEFEKARAYVAAALQREMESTAAQSTSALTRLLYRRGHPNYVLSCGEALELLQGYRLEDVASFHQRRFAPTDATVVFCGDLKGVAVTDLVAETLTGWPQAPRTDVPSYGGILTVPASDHVVVPDKSNTDVRLGHALELLRQDPDYVALYAGNYVLGGNFSARLMSEIRDRMGLTYGIWSSLSNVNRLHGGHWVVGVTLSNENVQAGIDATRREMERFVTEGITADELAEKQNTITGSFKVGLATTGGLALSLLYNAERGFGVDYLDRFPSLVEALRVDEVNDVIRTHLNPAALSLAVAGPDSAPGVQ